jgi:ribonuclease HI
MIHVFADGSYRSGRKYQRWAVVAILSDRSTHLRTGEHHASNSAAIERHAFHQAIELAHHLTHQHQVDAMVYTDHEPLLREVDDTTRLTFRWVPSSENRAHYWAYRPLRPWKRRDTAWSRS